MAKKNITRKHKFTVLLSDDEFEALQTLATKDGLCIADYIRQHIRRGVSWLKNPAD